MICIPNGSQSARADCGHFVVGCSYEFRERNEHFDRRETYVVSKRSARFVTLYRANSSPPHRRLAIRLADDGTEFVIIGHRNACALRLLWSVNFTRTAATGYTTSTVVLPSVATVGDL